jgi:hypothetical protein
MALEDGRNVELVPGGVEHIDPPIANELRIDYAPRSGGTPYRSAMVTGRDVGTSDATVVPARSCRASRLAFGRTLTADPVRTRVVYAESTARLVLGWMCVVQAFPWRRIVVAGLDPDVGALVPGDVVSITSARLSLTDQVAHVTDVSMEGDGIVATLVIITVPPRDSIPAGA